MVIKLQVEDTNSNFDFFANDEAYFGQKVLAVTTL